MEVRIGVIPLPVVIVLLAVFAYFLHRGKLPTEISMMIAVLGVGGFLCGELGKRLPILRDIGGGAILATFVPSALVFYKVLPAAIAKPVTDFTQSTQFLYLFIAAIIVGSILGMDRTVLIRGFLKTFVPLGLGSIAALVVGTGVGAALGLGVRHSLLYVVIPIMSGGVGEGAIPLSMGYADILHRKQGDIFAEVLPAVMLASLTAILLSGALNRFGKRYPQFTGEGRLQPGEHDEPAIAQEDVAVTIEVEQVAAAGSFAIALYLIGLVGKEAYGFPAPVAMLFLAVIAKLTSAVPKRMQEGANVVYRFFRVAVTYPLLFAIGVALTPWDKLMAALHWQNIVTIVSTVVTLMTTGWFVGRWMRLYPLESAIVNACHSGQGGTGDVAILTAANRMQLMPFAQIATRIGGAITVTLTLLALRWLR
ncbi:MAG: malate permease [Chthonomonadaceae bacterium]|nr:malate permease [Chthonomonadaceae bacterium]